MRSATLIPASIHKFSEVPLATVAKRKVAAYARVSTENEDQKTSYAAQVDYYTNYIKSRVDWEFAGMYSDEGVTGTSMEKREGFTHMVQDAPDGKIQLIVTKSVSRFARNTVDSLTTIRKLKEHGVEVYSGARRNPLDHSQQLITGGSPLHFGERHMGTQEKNLPTASSPSDTLTFSATIIDPAVFQMVQWEMERRTREGGRYSGVSIFSGKIRCGECGGYFDAKVWHSTDKYRRIIYRCNNKYDGKKCQTPHVTEEEIKEVFVTAFNRLVTERDEVIESARPSGRPFAIRQPSQRREASCSRNWRCWWK